METVISTKNLVFTNRVVGNKVFMLLDKGIGIDKDAPYILGSSFAEELYYWKSQGKDVTVKINSGGGKVFDGWSIIDAIRENEANTQVVGIAASMAGICLMFGKHRSAYNFSRIMIHAPRGGSKEFLNVIKGQFRDLLESRTKFTKDEINDMIDSGKDYFFDAKQALEKGIIDEVIETGKSVSINPSVLNDVSELHLIYNSALKEEFTNKSETEMEIFNKLFGGKSESENAIAAVQMKAENDTLKAEKAAWEKEKTSYENKLKELENAGKANEAKVKATALIEDAVKAGKLSFKDDAEKAKAVEGAIANYDFTKQMIDAMPTKKVVAAATIPAADGKQIETYEWLAKNDPKKLAAIAETDPELFNKLSDEYNASQTKTEAK